MSGDAHVSEHGTRGEKRVVAACAAGVLLFVGLVPLAVGEIGARTDDHGAKNTAKSTTTTTTTTSAVKKLEDASSAAGSASLTVLPRSLMPIPDDLAAFIGQRVSASDMTVQKVSSRGRGFWIGESLQQRAFVAYRAPAGDSAPLAGERVDLDGTLRPAPRQPGRSFLIPVADERVIQRQGAYIRADHVSRSR
jgi:hypothetical protein